MRKMMMVVTMVIAIIVSPVTAYSAELKTLKDELYDEAMLDLFYDNHEHDIEYYGYFKRNSSSIEYTVIGEKYYAMIYYNYDKDVYYGSIYTKKVGNFVSNLKDNDAYNIMSDMY